MPNAHKEIVYARGNPSGFKTSGKKSCTYNFGIRNKDEKNVIKQLIHEVEASEDGDQHFYKLVDLAKAAFSSGDDSAARSLAEELLSTAEQFRKDWNYGNAIHHGNVILGRLALKKGNLIEAKDHLKKAGGTPGSPQLNSFGPNMLLAKELLEKGERDAVIEYFEQCKAFWKLGRESLDQWTSDVKAGRTPKFGPNLVY